VQLYQQQVVPTPGGGDLAGNKSIPEFNEMPDDSKNECFMHHELQLCTEELLDLKKVGTAKLTVLQDQVTWKDSIMRMKTFNQLLENVDEALDSSEVAPEIKRTQVDEKVDKCEYCSSEFDKNALNKD
jgi:hypothetical protein